MYSKKRERQAKIDQTLTVHFECFDRRSANGCRSLYCGKIIAPCEMSDPIVEARIEQWHRCARLQVNACDAVTFAMKMFVMREGEKKSETAKVTKRCYCSKKSPHCSFAARASVCFMNVILVGMASY